MDRSMDLSQCLSVHRYLVKGSKMWVDLTVETSPNLMKNMKSLLTWISFRPEIENVEKIVAWFMGRTECIQVRIVRMIQRSYSNMDSQYGLRSLYYGVRETVRWTLIKEFAGKNSFRFNPYDFLFDLTFYIFDKA